MKNDPFFEQASLMLRVLPHIATEKCFALKGGTAINFFHRDMPRLSVDIDLNYMPIEPRDTSIKNISEALMRIKTKIMRSIPDVNVREGRTKEIKGIIKLFAQKSGAQIKVEPNLVLRGSIFQNIEKTLCKKAEDMFELSVSINTLSIADIYGSKICAALDRQHPRDLFDIKILLENEGITDDIRKAFVVYLASHDRPMNEIIDPIHKDIRAICKSDFQGMTSTPVQYEELIKTRKRLIKLIRDVLTKNERNFLISVKGGNPQWDLIALPDIEKLPAIQWKLINIRKMAKKKHAEAMAKLKSKLSM